MKRCCGWCFEFHNPNSQKAKAHKAWLEQARKEKGRYLHPSEIKELAKRPVGAKREGRCPECEEWAWLFEAYPGGPCWCLDCIKDARDDANYDEEPAEPEEWEPESAELGDGEEW